MEKYYDIHCHIFNKNIFVRQLGKVAIELTELSNVIQHFTGFKRVKQVLGGIKEALNTEIQDSIHDVYNTLNLSYKNAFITTPLPMDLTFADDNDGTKKQDDHYRDQIVSMLGKINFLINVLAFRNTDDEVDDELHSLKDQIKKLKTKIKGSVDYDSLIIKSNNYKNQLSEHEELARQNPLVRPFLAIDPRNERVNGEKLIDLVKEKFECEEKLFSGIKIYAPVGFSPTDPILMGDNQHPSIYAYCIENNLPITIHNSNSGFSCFSKQLKVSGHIINQDNELEYLKNEVYTFKEDFFGLSIGDAIKERAKTLNHPRLWKLVLEKFPDLTLNFAHFGGSGQIMEFAHYTFPTSFYNLDSIDFILRKIKDRAMRDLIEFSFVNTNGVFSIDLKLDREERKPLWLSMYEAGVIDNWSKAIHDILTESKYRNTYTDLSCFSEKNTRMSGSISKNLKKFKQLYFDTAICPREKMLYGSDFFLILLSGIPMDQYLADFKSTFGNEFDVIARDNPKRFLACE
jgi:hypothetical protein